MPTHAYPDFWPKANPALPESLQSRITEEQKSDLYNRRISTRKLAKELKVHEKWLSTRYPGKVPLPNTKLVIATRKEYRTELGKQILEGKYTVEQAADMVHCSRNTMYRHLDYARALYPELAKRYPKIIRKPNAKKS